MAEQTLPLDALHALIGDALNANKTDGGNANSVARALVMAEVDGKKTHGVSRVMSYAAQARSGKVDGFAKPVFTRPRPAILAINAKNGFAFPAFDIVRVALPDIARAQGIAFAAISHSHHHGVAGHHAEALAGQGLVAMVLGNTSAAIAPHGGKTPLFGTNPIAFAAPIENRPPLVIDFATSKVARGNILLARQKGEAIPEGWALDKNGNPTTDPDAALEEGSMIPIGEAKGAAIALMVEVIAAGLTGAAFGHEATSFFEATGAPPDTGQAVIAIDPAAMGNSMQPRLAALAEIMEEDGARLPGSNRMARRKDANQNGIAVDAKTLEAVRELC